MSETTSLPEPYAWESRFFDTHPQTVTSGTWSEWERVVPRNRYTDTVQDRVAEFQSYIGQGYRYELRTLYTADQLAAERAKYEALLTQAWEALERVLNCCDISEVQTVPNSPGSLKNARDAIAAIDKVLK